MQRRGLAIGHVLVLLGSGFFASKAIFIKLAYRELPDAMVMLVWRMIFSLPFFAAAWLYALRKTGAVPPGGAAAAFVWRAAAAGFLGYYLAMVLDFLGLLYVTAQLERLALFTYPIFVIALAAAFFGTHLTLGNILAGLITYLGLAVVFMTDMAEVGDGVWRGTALVLASALAFAFYQLWARELIAGMGSLLFTSVALTSASLASIVHFLLSRGAPPVPSWHYLSLALATAIIATVIPSFFVNAGMARIGAISTAMISTVSPLFTIALAVLLLGEHFGLIDGIGTALVVGGIGYHTWHDLRRGGIANH